MRHIIGLVGFQGSGKDTVGRIIRAQHPKFQTISFARPIKSSLCSMFGWSSDMMEGLSPESRVWRETPDKFWTQHLGRTITPREMMREFGTELIRNQFDQNFWTLSLRKRLESSKRSFVITDVRFTNEIEMIRELGGTLIWVRRDPLPNYYAQALWLNSQNKFVQFLAKPFLHKLKGVHRSEREWIGVDFDHIFLNNSSIDDLTKQVTEWTNTHVTSPKT